MFLLISQTYPVVADDFLLDFTLVDRMAKNYQIQAGDNQMLGDNIDLNSGLLHFEQLDISIPGNFPLPVEFRRTYQTFVSQWSQDHKSQLALADWSLRVPEIVYDVAHNAVLKPPGFKNNHQCSGGLYPPQVSTVVLNYPTLKNNNTSVTHISPDMYTSGPRLSVPGIAEEKLRSPWRGNISPVGIRGYKMVTGNFWRVSCIPLKVAGGEGFLVESPTGDKYYMDVLDIYQKHSPVTGIGEIDEHRFKASKVVDRFGNWVQYHYV